MRGACPCSYYVVGVFFFNLCMLRASKYSKYFYLWGWPCCKENAMDGMLVYHDGACGGFLFATCGELA